MNTAHFLSPPLTRSRLRWGLAALLVTALPFANDVPLWILAMLVAICAWRYFAYLRKHRPPPTVLRFILTLATFVLVWNNYHTINGLEAGTALLLVMAAMKLTETVRSRDLIVIVYMSLFLIVAHALFDQSIPATLYAGAATLVVLAALIQISRRATNASARPALRSAGLLTVQALPVLLLMFVLFPRVPGPFWSLPKTSTASTGLSNSMKPGSISELLRSSSVAFRVQFDGAAPAPSELYWRGPVFANVAKGSWSPAAQRPTQPDVVVSEPTFHYTITLEPHQQRWLFALDAPAPGALPFASAMAGDMQLLSDNPVSQRRRYRLASHPKYRLDAAGDHGLDDLYVDTSLVANPRTRDLALAWRDQSANDNELIRRALTYFNQEPFAYTLKPPGLPERGASDAFLFSTRRGFCEHYASSFALLMRYAGIPTRVVTGYQGGELNPISKHYTVRQSDAHAWTEVWLKDRGWVRIDPTAAVAPERVETGINAALVDGETLPALFLGSGAFFSRVRHTWDAINAAWNEQILGYGKTAQFDFLRKLGINAPNAAKLAGLLSVAMIVFLAVLAGVLAAHGRPHRDPLVRLYDQFCAKLARHQLRRAPGEGPSDFARRAASARPTLAAQIDAITETFLAERYGPAPSDEGRAALRRQIRDFAK